MLSLTLFRVSIGRIAGMLTITLHMALPSYPLCLWSSCDHRNHGFLSRSLWRTVERCVLPSDTNCVGFL